MSKLKLKIIEPCNQSWAGMSKSSDGKFCDSCNKQVVDFSHFTDKQLIDWIGKNGSVCGRLHQSQLDRVLIESNLKPSHSGFNRAVFFISSLLFVGFYKDASSKDRKPMHQESLIKKSFDNNKEAGLIDTSKVIRGKVVSQDEKLPLPGVSVLIKEINRFAYTDANGEFTINLPENVEQRQLKVSFSMIGFDAKTLNFDFGNSKELNVSLCLNSTVMGEVIIIKKSPYRLINKAKYYLRKINPLPLRDK